MSGEPWTIAWTTVVTLSAHRCSRGSESPASAKYSQRGCHSVLAFVLPLYVRQHCLDLLPLTQETDPTEGEDNRAVHFKTRRGLWVPIYELVADGAGVFVWHAPSVSCRVTSTNGTSALLVSFFATSVFIYRARAEVPRDS